MGARDPHGGSDNVTGQSSVLGERQPPSEQQLSCLPPQLPRQDGLSGQAAAAPQSPPNAPRVQRREAKPVREKNETRPQHAKWTAEEEAALKAGIAKCACPPAPHCCRQPLHLVPVCSRSDLINWAAQTAPQGVQLKCAGAQ